MAHAIQGKRVQTVSIRKGHGSLEHNIVNPVTNTRYFNEGKLIKMLSQLFIEKRVATCGEDRHRLYCYARQKNKINSNLNKG